MLYTKHDVLHQDMVAHGLNRFMDTGQVLPPAQRRIYENLAVHTGRKFILEAGMGIGAGAAILRGKPFIYKGKEAVHRIIVSTYKNEDQVSFAAQMWPHGRFDIWDVESGPYPAKLYDLVVAVEVIEHVADPELALRNMMLSCREGVWLSTPNRNAPGIQDDTPRNPHHVAEYTPEEIWDMVQPLGMDMTIRHWDTFEVLDLDTQVTPLVYELIL